MNSISSSSATRFLGIVTAPWPRVRLRIVDGDPDLQVAEVAPREPLGDAQRLAVREPAVVQPGHVVEPDRLDDERVAFPLAHRVAEPGRLGIGRQRTAVGEDLAIVVVGFEQHHGDRGRLDDLRRRAQRVEIRHAVRNAALGRPALPVVRPPFVVERLRGGPERHLDAVRRQVLQPASARRQPDSRQIDFAVSSLRRRRVQVRLAVGRARDAGCGIPNPLRRGGDGPDNQACHQREPAPHGCLSDPQPPAPSPSPSLLTSNLYFAPARSSARVALSMFRTA